MPHDNPYDQRESDARDEDLRQRRADEADEVFNERRQLRIVIKPETEAPCSCVWSPDNWDIDECSGVCDLSGKLQKRSPADDLTHNETRGE